ncbi:hypothetical protein TI04_06375 [Achromatium sp. WMS2]|nr:hypothetical protein TI04_06375 [Achromatium sp. WMS2]
MNALNRSKFGCPAFSGHGFTIVELMVAMVLGIFLSIGLIQMLAGNKASYKTRESLSRMQEDSSFAMDYLSEKMRIAGFDGCGKNSNVTNTLSLNSPPFWWQDYGADKLIRGFDGTDDGNGAESFSYVTGVTKADGTDAVIALLIDTTNTYFASSYTKDDATFAATVNTLDRANNSHLVADDIVLFCDGFTQKTALLRVDSVNTSTPSLTCTGSLTAVTVTPVTSGNSPGRFMDYIPMAFYLAPSKMGSVQSTDDTYLSLYQLQLGRNCPTNGGGTTPYCTLSQELVKGVQNMQILYGVDTDVTANGAANQYLTATSVTDWTRVVSMRIYLLIASTSTKDQAGHTPAAVVDQQQTGLKFPSDFSTNLAGTDYSLPSNDLRLYKVYTLAVRLRNR